MSNLQYYWNEYRAEMIAAGVIVCLVIVVGVSYISNIETAQDRQSLYAAWCKLNHRQDITLNEWQTLRKNYLLPGTEIKRAVDAAESAQATSLMAIGLSAGAQAK